MRVYYDRERRPEPHQRAKKVCIVRLMAARATPNALNLKDFRPSRDVAIALRKGSASRQEGRDRGLQGDGSRRKPRSGPTS